MTEILHTEAVDRPPPWLPPDASRWGAPRIVAVAMLVLAASVLGTLRYVGADRFSTGTERVLQAIAFAAITAAPAALAAMSPRRRAILLVPAAMILTPLAMLSLTGVLLPLLIPAVLLWVALVTRWDGLPCGLVRAGLAIVLVLGLLVLAGVVLFVHQDPRSYGGGTITVSGNTVSGSCFGGIGVERRVRQHERRGHRRRVGRLARERGPRPVARVDPGHSSSKALTLRGRARAMTGTSNTTCSCSGPSIWVRE